MQYISNYDSPLGKILIACDETGLTGLWFEGQKYFASNLGNENIEKETDLIKETKKLLDEYFEGKEPDFTLPLHYTGSDFQKEVQKILCEIPYGTTRTYGEIAKMLAKIRKTGKMSARAVGNAVAHNGISIIIPCHRVVGKNGALTGYAGGIDRKIKLLEIEGVKIR